MVPKQATLSLRVASSTSGRGFAASRVTGQADIEV
jgi:hypothetical protein